MQFSSLRLAGFKSFADPVDIELVPGLTGVVGPNGCGKSNLVEALRWVMGESTASRMRGAELEDVIFNGSGRRAAHGFAEVALVVDNADRSGPAVLDGFSEVTVTRRIERSRGSSYRINGQEARAREVRLLFHDVGTGSRSASIIAQGRIGELISASPDERRLLLEEAANLGGIRARRREASLRLEHSHANLERVADRLAGLAQRLDGLRHQEREVRRYRSLGQAIRDAEAALLYLEWHAASADHADQAGQCLACETAVRDAAGLVATETATRERRNAVLPALREAAVRAATETRELELARSRINDERARLARDRAQAQTRLQQIGDDLARETGLRQEAEGVLARLAGEERTLAAWSGARQLSRAAEAVDAAECRLDAVARRLSELGNRIATTDARRDLLERQFANAETRERDLADREQALAARQASVRQSAATGEELDAARVQVAAAETAVGQAQEAAESAESARRNARDRLETAAAACAEGDADIARVEAEAGALRRLLVRDMPGEPALDGLEVEPGCEMALGAVLGDDLSAPLVAAGDTTARRGWVERPDPPVSCGLPDGTRTLAGMVGNAGRMGVRLAQIGVVDDAETARTLQPRLAPGQRLTTPHGGLWRWDGYFEDVGQENAASLRMRNRARLAELEAARAAITERRARFATEREQARRAHEEAVASESAGHDALRNARRILETARAHETRLVALHAEATATAESLADSAKRLAGEQETAHAETRTMAAELEALDDLSACRQERERLGTEHERREQQLAEARRARDELEIEARQRAGRIEQIEADTRTWNGRLEQAGERIDALAGRRKETAEWIEELEGVPGRIEARSAELESAIETARARHDRADRTLAGAEAALEAADRATREAEAAALACREQLMRAETAKEQADHRLEVVRRSIRERLDTSVDELCTAMAGIEQDADSEAISLRLERLRLRRDRMGPVNLRAEIEIDELRAEMSALEDERDDLVGAVERLREAIEVMDREGRRRLRAAFTEIDSNFRQVFRRLFAGGFAKLVWVETSDPLSPGLDVIASPPGKTARVLSLLSGGEQALTSLALVFAAFMTSPSPICVLDEVDAPLDDRNVDRFCDLLAEVARQTDTRFLVITHHRLTMARMDRLYGVTMAERGISRLVSVDIREARRLAPAA